MKRNQSWYTHLSRNNKRRPLDKGQPIYHERYGYGEVVGVMLAPKAVNYKAGRDKSMYYIQFETFRTKEPMRRSQFKAVNPPREKFQNTEDWYRSLHSMDKRRPLEVGREVKHKRLGSGKIVKRQLATKQECTKLGSDCSLYYIKFEDCVTEFPLFRSEFSIKW